MYLLVDLVRRPDLPTICWLVRLLTIYANVVWVCAMLAHPSDRFVNRGVRLVGGGEYGMLLAVRVGGGEFIS